MKKTSLMKKFIATVIGAGFLVACQPGTSDQPTEESSASTVQIEALDVATAPEVAADTARTAGAPDIIMIEGFGNFIHSSNSGHPVADAVSTAIGLVQAAGLCGQDANEDSRLGMAKLYWCGYLYGIPGFSTGMLDVSSGHYFSGKVGYLQWDTGYRIGRSDNGVNKSQLYDNYDGNGSEGLITRFNRLLDGTHGQSQAAGHQFCQNGCVLISHSTGGTTMDVLLAETYQADTHIGLSGQSLYVPQGMTVSQAKKRVWEHVTVGIQIASAAGGVGLAQEIVDVLETASCSNGDAFSGLQDGIKWIAQALFIDYECSNGQVVVGSEGAGHDLKNTYSRQGGNTWGSRSDFGATPILMVAGQGKMADLSMNGGLVTQTLAGVNDGLVAYHSSCGASSQNGPTGSASSGYQSCHPKVDATGYVGSYRAPSGFYANHHPYIMTEEGHGSQIFKGVRIDAITDAAAEIFTLGFADTTQHEVLVPPANWNNSTVDTFWADNFGAEGEVESASVDPYIKDYGQGKFSNKVDDVKGASGCGFMDYTCYKVDRMLLEDDGKHLAELIGKKFDFWVTDSEI